jgi:hypothetical protein
VILRYLSAGLIYFHRWWPVTFTATLQNSDQSWLSLFYSPFLFYIYFCLRYWDIIFNSMIWITINLKDRLRNFRRCLWDMFLQDWFISTDDGQWLSQPLFRTLTRVGWAFPIVPFSSTFIFFKVLRFYFHMLHFKVATILQRNASVTSSVAILNYKLIIFIYCINKWLGKYFLMLCIPVLQCLGVQSILISVLDIGCRCINMSLSLQQPCLHIQMYKQGCT